MTDDSYFGICKPHKIYFLDGYKIEISLPFMKIT